MEQRSIFAYIPPNIGDNGGLLGGLVNTRNAIEAAIGALIALMFYGLLNIFLPTQIAIYAALLIGILLVVICLKGIGGEPFSIFIANCINYENRRNFVTLKPPIPSYLLENSKEDDYE